MAKTSLVLPLQNESSQPMRFVLEPLCESFIVLPGQQVEVHAVFDEDTDNRSFTVAPNDGFLVVYAPGEIRGFVDHYVTLDGVRMEPQPGSAEQTRIAPAGNIIPRRKPADFPLVFPHERTLAN